MKTAFENSQPVATVDFQYPQDEPQRDDETKLRSETATRLLQFLASGSVEDGTRKLQLVAFIYGALQCETQRELAERLGVSPARVNQQLNELRPKIAQFNEGNEP